MPLFQNIWDAMGNLGSRRWFTCPWWAYEGHDLTLLCQIESPRSDPSEVNPTHIPVVISYPSKVHKVMAQTCSPVWKNTSPLLPPPTGSMVQKHFPIRWNSWDVNATANASDHSLSAAGDPFQKVLIIWRTYSNRHRKHEKCKVNPIDTAFRLGQSAEPLTWLNPKVLEVSTVVTFLFAQKSSSWKKPISPHDPN